MNNSNWTLKFSRTGREAYGYDVVFDHKDPDRHAWVVVVFGLGLIVGMTLGFLL
jgi:hypothetical protein